MTKFTATFNFGSNIGIDEATAWLATIKQQLPEGTEASLKSEPMVIDVTELTDAHKGEQIKLWVKGFGEVEGKLEAVFKAGSKTQDESRTLVIDGRAWTVNYGLATLSAW